MDVVGDKKIDCRLIVTLVLISGVVLQVPEGGAAPNILRVIRFFMFSPWIYKKKHCDAFWCILGAIFAVELKK